MLKNFSLLLALAFNFSAAFASSPQKWITPDFFIEEGHEQVVQPYEPFADSQESCREHIRKVMCLADPAPNGGVGQDRPCLPGGDAYAVFFETLYDHYPLSLQKMFCSLKVIYVEKEFSGTAYAGTIKDPSGKIVGAQMGIRKSVLDSQLNLSAWASWKEQLSFGGKTDSYEKHKRFKPPVGLRKVG